jgi:Tfp pilus assembly protein PilE
MQIDDVIYMAKVPQILAELANTDKPAQLSQWLAGQGLDWHNSILAYGTEIDHMPRDIYYFYLTFVQTLADLAGTEIDLFALPTAQELNLPPTGRLSLSVHSDSQGFSLEIDYEYSLAEHLIRPETGMVTVAVVGILMAYAVPAYRDYTLRAKVMQSMTDIAAIKMAVAEHYIATGELSGSGEQLTDLPTHISVDDDSGMITVYLKTIDNSFDDEDYVQLIPEVNDTGIQWHCESTVRAKLLPAVCR